MLALLCGVFWLTVALTIIRLAQPVVGRHHTSRPYTMPSCLLCAMVAHGLACRRRLPCHGVGGIGDVAAWLSSSLFTLLEDFGYLPRVAFNLDELFRRSGAHGKRALTMSMGFGCNTAGVVSTRHRRWRERLVPITPPTTSRYQLAIADLVGHAVYRFMPTVWQHGLTWQ